MNDVVSICVYFSVSVVNTLLSRYIMVRINAINLKEIDLTSLFYHPSLAESP